MSFKTKRWGSMGQKLMSNYVPGIKAYQTPGGAGINTGGWAVPFGGKIVVMAYAADDTPLYTFYDPLTDSVSGTTLITSGQVWYRYSYFYGYNATFVVWGATHLLICPLLVGYNVARDRLCGFDTSLNFRDPPFLYGDRTIGYMNLGLGVSGGEPCFISYQRRQLEGDHQALIKHTLAGPSMEYNGPCSFYYDQGSPWYSARRFEGYWGWKTDAGYALFGSPPYGSFDGALLYGDFGNSWTGHNCASRYFTPDPSGNGQTWMYVDPAEGDPYWALALHPLESAGARPWGGYLWEYRHTRDGGYTLSDHDLDGINHEVPSISTPGTGPITKLSNGWYAGVSSVDTPTSFTVYLLDPEQPVGQRRTQRKSLVPTSCFLGDYGIGTDLKLANVLPIPEGRNPSGTSYPPQHREDNYIVGKQELYQQRANEIVFLRNMKTQFAGYAFGEDWWFPGEDESHALPTTLDFFTGSPTVMGRYPDYMWGRLNPLGYDVSRGIGIPEEHFNSVEPDPVFVVRNSQLISGTSSWVTPGATGYAILRGSLFDDRICYHEVYRNLGSAPQWHARGGRIVGGQWEELVNFEDLGLPPLGNDGWTIYGVAIIPPCRSLRKGGWLVCADLYFAPWESWEWDPGPRDLTFRDTGQGWVPAIWGYEGPLQIEDWHPHYLTGYDEWTYGRSDYGPAALIVYDYQGTFVECLNNSNMYPPYAGSEIAVLPGTVPLLMYRVKGGGTYSDSAEGWGCYQNSGAEADFQSPLMAVYELENRGKIEVGAGPFVGFVDMYDFEQYELKAEGWRWDALASSYSSTSPRSIWSPYSRVKVAEGAGGSGITLLTPGPAKTKTGIRGVASRCRL